MHFSRAEGTERKLAEHRAKLCLLGLKELQKSWDLNYWVLEIFFHCLDESTAEYLQLSEEKNAAPPTPSLTNNGSVDTATPKQVGRNMQLLPEIVTSALSPFEQHQYQQEEVLKEQRPQTWSEMTPLSPPSNEVDIDLSEPFLFDEEFARNFGSCTPRLDALNSSNLDCLYRYL